MEKPKKSPGQVFADFQADQLAERAAREHKWDLPQVERLDQAIGEAIKAGDHAKQIELESLKNSHVTASNERGDFRYPHQMGRDEAKEHFASKGITGVLWSTGEEYAIMTDPALRADYGDEVKTARKENRVIDGPQVRVGKGKYKPGTYHFSGESLNAAADPKGHELFKKNLNEKLAAIDKRKALERKSTHLIERVEKARAADAYQPGELLHIVEKAIKETRSKPSEYTSEMYPYNEQPAWNSVLSLHSKLVKETTEHGEKLKADAARHQAAEAVRQRAASAPRAVEVTEPVNPMRLEQE
jgi:hypothetical protein